MARKVGRPSFYTDAVCRVCKLQQQSRGWYSRSSPRCSACGGLLDRKYVKLMGDLVIINPNIEPEPEST